MPCKEWKEIRLDRIYKELSALQDALFKVEEGMEFFIESEQSEQCIDSIIYGKDTVEGVSELISDIKNDIMLLIDQIKEEENNNQGIDLN